MQVGAKSVRGLSGRRTLVMSPDVGLAAERAGVRSKGLSEKNAVMEAIAKFT